MPYLMDFRFKSKSELNSLWKALLQVDSAGRGNCYIIRQVNRILDPNRHRVALGRNVGFGKAEFMKSCEELVQLFHWIDPVGNQEK